MDATSEMRRLWKVSLVWMQATGLGLGMAMTLINHIGYLIRRSIIPSWMWYDQIVRRLVLEGGLPLELTVRDIRRMRQRDSDIGEYLTKLQLQDLLTARPSAAVRRCHIQHAALEHHHRRSRDWRSSGSACPRSGWPLCDSPGISKQI